MIIEVPVSSSCDLLPSGDLSSRMDEAVFLNITVHAMTMNILHDAISHAISCKEKWLIANHNLHSMYLLYKHGTNPDNALAEYYRRSKWTHIDGMSIVVLARLCGHAIQRSHRIAYNQTLPHLLTLAAEQGWRVFYLGSSESVSTAGWDYMQSTFPKLCVETHHGYFTKERESDENKAVLARIKEFDPHILFVGMGMPVQEEWIAANYDSISANVILASGATLDYFVGALPRPPAWIGNLGLEWLYRLVNEPHRLAFRYLVEPWYIVFALLRGRIIQLKPR